jgi:predicted acyltransferase
MKHILPVIVVLVGSYLLLRYLRRSPITSVSQTLNIVAVVALVVIATASATRMGYLIYPINYAVWASVFRTSTDQLILDA